MDKNINNLLGVSGMPTIESPNANDNTEKILEDNGENRLDFVASIFLWIYIIVYAIGTLVAFENEPKDGAIVLISGGLGLLLVLISYWTIKVFTNISRKATAIYQLLEEHKKIK
mgnify:CR=1 FL=1